MGVAVEYHVLVTCSAQHGRTTRYVVKRGLGLDDAHLLAASIAAGHHVVFLNMSHGASRFVPVHQLASIDVAKGQVPIGAAGEGGVIAATARTGEGKAKAAPKATEKA